MIVAADTNVLIRAVIEDNATQARAAMHLLSHADSVAISLPCFCEFAWVLGRVYKMAKLDIASAIETYIQAHNVIANRPAVEAGLAMLYEGGDFADGVLSFEGRQSGAATFVSFDKDAVRVLKKQGHSARLLS